MNKKILSAIFAFAVCMSSCNYLDYNESSGFDKEDMFTYFERAKGMLTTVYSYLYLYFIFTLPSISLFCTLPTA